MVVTEEHDGTTRYRLHETMRQYARERLDDDGDGELVRRRHAEHYVAVSEELVAGYKGRAVERSVSWFDLEFPNLSAALDWAIAAGEAELALRIALTFLVRPGRRTLADALNRVTSMPEARDHALRLQAIAFSGIPAMVESGDIELAVAQIRMTDAAFEEAGLPLTAPAHLAHAIVAVPTLDPAVVRRHGMLAVELSRGAGEQFQEGFYCATVSTLLTACGLVDEAVQLARRGQALGTELGNGVIAGMADTALGYALSLEDPEAAIAQLEVGVAKLRAVKDETLRFTGERCWARLLAARGCVRDAATIYLGTLDTVGRFGARMQVFMTCETIAVDLATAGYRDAAVAILGALDVIAPTLPRSAMVPRDAVMEALREELGAERFEAARGQGRALDLTGLIRATRAALSDVLAGTEPT
jgi:hypothetical protein